MTTFESNLAAVIEELQNQMDTLNITGTVQSFAQETVPTGWLKADGSAVSRTDYADLYAVIGTTYGTGDGSTTFNLPNLQDKFSLGKGSTYSTLGATGGESTHTLTVAEMPAHFHTVMEYAGPSGVAGANAYNNHINAAVNAASTDGTSIVGGSGVHNNMPPYIVLNYCIKY